MGRKPGRLAPGDSRVVLNLGLAYFKEDDYRHALPLFARLRRTDGTNLQALNLLATCQIYTGQERAAIGLLSAAVRQRPNPASLYLLGVACARS
ncbi:MAG: tetratricopeptide repeat protein [Terriglobia bacterium]